MKGSYRFDRAFIENVLDHTNIVELIGRYVSLEKSGQNYKGLCPFHNEKTPSFMVNENKRIFKCFGCGKGGNAIDFVMERENLNFPQAMERLCEYAHIDLPEQRQLTEEEMEKKDKRKRQLQLHTELARFYHRTLQSNVDSSKTYLIGRGVKEKYIRKFGLGYEKGDGKSIQYLYKKGFNEEELLESKIFRKKNDRVYCIFFRRIMFPIFDTRTRVIAFGGRTTDKDGQPKYLNSPESILFFKKNQLYGLNYVIKDNSDKIVLVEGYMDVISLVQNGVSGAVASLGTSLTTEQARMIKFPDKKVYICYDSDKAGIKATKRAINILKSENVSPYIIGLGDAKDPDEYFKNHTLGEFGQNIRDAKTPLTFEIDTLKNSYNMQIFTQKQEYIQKATKLIKCEKDPLEKEYQTKRLADQTQTSINTISKMVYGYYSSRQFGGHENKSIQKRSLPKLKVKDNPNEAMLIEILKKNESLIYYVKKILSPDLVDDEYLRDLLLRDSYNKVNLDDKKKTKLEKITTLAMVELIEKKLQRNKELLENEKDIEKLNYLSSQNIRLMKQREELKYIIKGMI